MKKAPVGIEDVARAIIEDWADRAPREARASERFLMRQTVEIMKALLGKLQRAEEVASELSFAIECQLATIDEVESRARTPKHVLERHRSIGRRLVAFAKNHGVEGKGPRLQMVIAEAADAERCEEEVETDVIRLEG